MTSFSAAERAAVTRVDATAAAATEVLAFRLGREEYGIDILRVQEIRSFEVPTRIAGAPQCVLGVSTCGEAWFPWSTCACTSA
jgi:purine-binding chemotaxis protein CheW